ncbi:hypothetical protein [Burkholderia contaminans]|uniref:hypothetical protein n=1 Tax=Burkholderia contaminans TaxID=488447 RepID=UPI0015834B36|nr:hypothetical protein [Burkholderia contaminans]
MFRVMRTAQPGERAAESTTDIERDGRLGRFACRERLLFATRNEIESSERKRVPAAAFGATGAASRSTYA